MSKHCKRTYLNMRLISPFNNATISGIPIHAGTRYNSAGYNSNIIINCINTKK